MGRRGFKRAVLAALLWLCLTGTSLAGETLDDTDVTDGPAAEFASCAVAEQPDGAVGLDISVCDQGLLISRFWRLGDLSPEVVMTPRSGNLHTRVPLRVSELDPATRPVVRPTVDSPMLIVWASVTYPPAPPGDWMSSPPPLAVLFPPLNVKAETAIRIDTTNSAAWTLSDLNGNVLAAAQPRDAYSVVPPPPRPVLVTARRHGVLTRVSFQLNRPFDGQSMFFVLARVRGRYSWDRVVRTRLSYEATSGSFLIRLPRGASALKLITTEGSDAFRTSRPVVLRRRG